MFITLFIIRNNALLYKENVTNLHASIIIMCKYINSYKYVSYKLLQNNNLMYQICNKNITEETHDHLS